MFFSRKNILALFLLPTLLFAKNIYVSHSGNDKNPGTIEKPLASFAKAQTLAREFSKQEAVEIIFANGT